MQNKKNLVILPYISNNNFYLVNSYIKVNIK